IHKICCFSRLWGLFLKFENKINRGCVMITKEQVLKALSYVEDPDFKKDLVTLNMIKDIEITPDTLSFSVELTTPACPMKEHLENACRNAIAHFVSKDIEVKINMTSRVMS